jgi:hypothetical protein
MERHCLQTTSISFYKAKTVHLSMGRPTVYRGEHEGYPICSSSDSWQKRVCISEDGGQPHERIHRI